MLARGCHSTFHIMVHDKMFSTVLHVCPFIILSYMQRPTMSKHSDAVRAAYTLDFVRT